VANDAAATVAAASAAMIRAAISGQ